MAEVLLHRFEVRLRHLAIVSCFALFGCASTPPESPKDYEVVAGDKNTDDSTDPPPRADEPASQASSDAPLTPEQSPVDRTPPGCSDKCKTDARQCNADAAKSFSICARGASGCLEWGEATRCTTGMECTGAGACTPATDLAVGSPCTTSTQCASKSCSSCPYYAGTCCVPKG